MRLKESPLCSFCSEEEETFTHLFLVCTFSSKLWRDIQRTFRSKLTLPDLSERTIKLGFIDGESLSIIENHTLLLYKRAGICLDSSEIGSTLFTEDQLKTGTVRFHMGSSWAS